MIMLMRIDRLLCELNIGTRSRVKELLKRGQVTVNGTIVTKADTKVNETTDQIICQGKEYHYQPLVYYMMNKPAGIISATADLREKTVLDLFCERMSEANKGELTGIPVKDIFPVGRLDKDTVGLLLLTNDGETAHRLLAPGSHVPKKYFVKINRPLDAEAFALMQNGVDIGEKVLTRPARLESYDENSPQKPEYYLTITEGRFHQVKRMFQAVGREVIYLKRVSMGSLELDKTLSEGQVRELTQEEVDALCSGK